MRATSPCFGRAVTRLLAACASPFRTACVAVRSAAGKYFPLQAVASGFNFSLALCTPVGCKSGAVTTSVFAAVFDNNLCYLVSGCWQAPL